MRSTLRRSSASKARKPPHPALFFIAAAVFSALPLFAVLSPYVGRGESTTGTVTNVAEYRGGSSRRADGTTCEVTARYTVNGVDYVADTGSTRSSAFCDVRYGEQVTVRYDSDDPRDGAVAIGGFSMLKVLPALVILLGTYLGLRVGATHRGWFADRERVRAVLLWKPVDISDQGRTTGDGRTTRPMAGSVEPAWHLTQDGQHWRWHDGTGWTDITQPVDPGAA